MSQADLAVELSNVHPLPDGNDSAADASNTAFPELASNLPRTDGGLAAWRLLLAAFVFETLLWGFPLSFGVFQDYYSRLPELRDNPYISIVGTTASGIGYLGAPLIYPLVRRWSKYRTQISLVQTRVSLT